MRIEVNMEKKYFFGLLIIGLVLIGIVGVVAWNADVTATSGNPPVFGHSVDEMDWSKAIPKNISAAGFCMGGVCKTSWEGLGGSVTGGVTNVNSLWANSSGGIIYYNDGNVGIGTSSPASKLSVEGIIQSTTGGFKFPDGSVQTKALNYPCANGRWEVVGQGSDYYGPPMPNTLKNQGDNCRTYPSNSTDWHDYRDPYMCSTTAGVDVNKSCTDVLDWDYSTNGPGLNYRKVYCKPYYYAMICQN